MARYVFAYLATALFFLVLDGFWLGTMAPRVYRPLVGDMLLATFRVGPAAAFYLLYVLGVVLMAVAPALRSGDWRVAALNGAYLGFFAYATYDLTNLATLKHWSLQLSIIDMAWGTFATCLGATLGFGATTWLAARFSL